MESSAGGRRRPWEAAVCTIVAADTVDFCYRACSVCDRSLPADSRCPLCAPRSTPNPPPPSTLLYRLLFEFFSYERRYLVVVDCDGGEGDGGGVLRPGGARSDGVLRRRALALLRGAPFRCGEGRGGSRRGDVPDEPAGVEERQRRAPPRRVRGAAALRLSPGYRRAQERLRSRCFRCSPVEEEMDVLTIGIEMRIGFWSQVLRLPF
ncbi:uncharacterized protein LOC109714184 isoform X2 [Ananas comosus]|uniref:Uncharacterized protein LOC109714184 isoform X2 n=1 Tax=Ananas comosus TaxID=4615 RepID=A0A6P5FF96_ANACO|nr:uncharacterized protein LOC109714184 isoform X2 [Ananas comosus]